MEDYGRPRQTMADQAIVISAVLPASLMHFLDHTGEMMPPPGLGYLHHIELLHKVQVSREEGPPRILTIQTFAKSENKFLSENYEGESSFFQQLLPSQHQIVEH